MHITVATFVTLLAASVAAGAAGNDEPRTLRRPYDPVVIPTARLAGSPDRSTARFRLYRFTGGAPVPIRHQFDPRDAAGELVVDGPVDFTFDANDELVFMAADAGDRADPTAWPADWEQVAEIEIADPRAGNEGRAWAYLVWFDQPPPLPALAPYVTVDPGSQRVRSDDYEVEYANGRNFFTGIRLATADGSPRQNLLRQSRMRGSPTFSLFFKRVTLDFTEQNSLIDLEGVRVGPVRAVRRARLTIDLGSFFPELPGGVAYTYHYRSAYLTPSRIRFSGLLLRALREFRFENLLEFAPTALPLRYFDRTSPDGMLVSGAGGQEVLSGDDHEWWVHSGDAGTMLHAFVIPQRWLDWGVARGTLVRPAVQTAAAGTAMGYTLQNMMRLREAGNWDLGQVSVALRRRFQPGDEEDALALVRAPLSTEVRWSQHGRTDAVVRAR
jgi:hypothetical protein